MQFSARSHLATENPLSARTTSLFDAAGQQTALVNELGNRQTFTYDVSNRLLSEGRSGANSYAQTFTYDSAGNRTLKNVDSARTTYVYDTANQLDYSQAAAGRTTYVYDQNGNQRVEQPPAGGRTTVTWDYETQPTEYQLPSGSRMTLAYNADNRRVEKETSSGLTQFIWDAALDAYHAELDGSGSLHAVYTNPPVPFGNLISQRRGTTSHWHHPDSLGSTWALTDASESITDTYLVDAWGNPLSSTGSTINPFRWVGSVGYYFDPVTGLYYIRARVYQPTIARWTSVDPLFYMMAKAGRIGFRSKVPVAYGVGFTLYEYVSGRPVSALDPSGHRKCEIREHRFSETKSCEVFQDFEGNTKFGSEFLQLFQFEQPCKCCRYRQRLLSQNYIISYVIDEVEYAWPGSPGVKDVGEGEEDCVKDENDRPICYGDPNNGYRYDQYNNCMYQMIDAPGAKLKQLTSDMGLTPAMNAEIKIYFYVRLQLSIEDNCCRKETIFSKIYDIYCGPTLVDPVF